MQRLAVAVLLLFFLTPFGFAICNNCEPDPTSSTYQSTIGQRPKSYNWRIDSNDGNLIHIWEPGLTHAPQIFGSSSYTYAIPIMHFAGRNGLDLDLTLYYNSRVWTRNSSASSMTFNADRDWPSPGFRLGFGSIEMNGNDSNYILTEGNGAKHVLSFTSTYSYNSSDSTYINYNPSTKVLIYKNGTRVTYEPFWVNNANSTTLFRPNQIKDTNGNFITITYVNHTEQSINTITDTLGRVINFNYDGNSNLQSVTDGFHTYGFTFNTAYPLRYTFSGTTAKDTVTSGTNITVLTQCIYPSGTGYTFTYGDWGIVNTINSVAAPIAPAAFPGVTRASQSYDFPAYTTSQSDSPTYSNQTIYDGINTAAWNYATTKSGSLISTISILDPVTSNGPRKKLVTTLSTAGDFTQGLVTQTQIIDVTNNNTTLRTVANAWINTSNGPQLASVTTTNDAGQTSKVAYTYTTNGNVSSVAEYDFGPTLSRTTSTTYLTTYTTQHILERPTQVLIKNASGTTVSRTDLAYDGTSLASLTGLATHDDTNYPATFVSRGNLTQLTKYSNASTATGVIQRNFTYDMLGNMLTGQFDCCGSTSWTYDSSTNYALRSSITRGGTPSLSTTATYDSQHRLLQMTDENGQTLTYGYDDAAHTDRVVALTRDANTSDSATFTTTYDDTSLHPVTQSSNSVNELVQKSYVDASNRSRRDVLSSSTLISSDVGYVDALGRTYKVSNPFGPNDTEMDTTTTFDALNRPINITRPVGGSSQFSYVGSSVQVTDPAGKTRKNFSDALGRLIRVDEPGWGNGTPGHGSVSISGVEGNIGHWSVCNAQCQAAGGQSEWIVDAWDTGTVSLVINGSTTTSVNYGQNSNSIALATALTQAVNNDPNQLVNASASGTTLTITARTANATTNYPAAITSFTTLSGMNQPSFTGTSTTLTGAQDPTSLGAPSLSTPMTTNYAYDALNNLVLIDQPPQSRTYQFDSLGRVISAKTPETSQAAVSYTYDDPGSGQVLTRTDPNGTVTHYAYDTLNRLASISYNPGIGVAQTPGTTYTYGTSTTSHNNGRLISVSDSATSPAWSTSYGYNQFGQVTGVVRAIGSDTYSTGYSYNTDGTLQSTSYPSGRIVKQDQDANGRMAKLYDSTTPSNPFLNSFSYNAAGLPLAFAFGNGVNASFGYNENLQISSIRYAKAGQPDFLNLSYGYGTTTNNAQIAGITDLLDSTKSQSFTYDAWGRLSVAQAGPNGVETWKYSYNYDRFGNRLNQNPIAGSLGNQVYLTVDSNTNHVIDVGTSYDANGNVTQDGPLSQGFHAYTYDAENRVATVDTNAFTYGYDGRGLRISKAPHVGTTTVYVFSGSKVIAEYAPSVGTNLPMLLREYIYSGSKLIATLTPNGTQPATVVYAHLDHLSTRVETDSAGSATPVRTYGHLPFGETWYETGTASKWKFTSYEAGVESNLNYALMRYHSARLGRFMSGDPVGGILSSPQSHNRYAYVGDDPINHVDPLGLWSLNTCIVVGIPVCGGGSGPGEVGYGGGGGNGFVNIGGNYVYIMGWGTGLNGGISDLINGHATHLDGGVGSRLCGAEGFCNNNVPSSECGRAQLVLCFGVDILNRGGEATLVREWKSIVTHRIVSSSTCASRFGGPVNAMAAMNQWQIRDMLSGPLFSTVQNIWKMEGEGWLTYHYVSPAGRTYAGPVTYFDFLSLTLVWDGDPERAIEVVEHEFEHATGGGLEKDSNYFTEGQELDSACNTSQ
jgi:RHS repeat-associated protein